jgi:hypothetical protein
MRLWPDPAWPAAVCGEVRARPSAALTAALRLARVRVEPTHVELEVRGDPDVHVLVVVFPRQEGQRYLGSDRLAFAYRVRAGSHDLRELQRAFAAALARAERRIPSPGILPPS